MDAYDVVSQRIILFLNGLGLPKRQIALRLGVSAQGFGEAMNNQKLSKKLINKIIRLYPEVTEVINKASEPGGEI